MTKQEEIRKVIDTHVDDGCHFPDRSCDALGSGYCSSADEHYRCLTERLDKIGLAIKVDREMPDSGYDCDGYYLEVEPLIKEG